MKISRAALAAALLLGAASTGLAQCACGAHHGAGVIAGSSGAILTDGVVVTNGAIVGGGAITSPGGIGLASGLAAAPGPFGGGASGNPEPTFAYSYYSNFPYPSREYVPYGNPDNFTFLGDPYGSPTDRFSWSSMSSGGSPLARYYRPALGW